jgi:tetratricopeptide (TPR) repeat protein
MTAAGPKSVDEIVREAAVLSPRERPGFVRDACSTDDALYASAMAKLESREQWFDSDPGDADFDSDALPPDAAGQRIGPYCIVRSLGQGGMGEVFLAERADDQFRQQVAIKLVRRGLLSRQVRGRLRQERQILATLDHPNIARLFDGGSTPDGTPYIVMEYVDGEPIDIYCDKRGLGIEARLKLFITVCSAVHRAHQNLIVHRDLKPSNILVTADGTPKLLDFGIAKLLDERQMMHTMAVTQADVRVMTPDHASPEQIRGEPITTASDIYVLGVLFYELLTGFKPFVLRGTRLAELERAICEEAPLPPSAAIAAAQSTENSGVAQVANLRSLTPARLQRALRGDIDNIALMAMRKESERRYSSVEQFAADINRYLDGMPVLARADAWSYRAGKFVRRHAVVVTLSIAFAALLLGFSVTTYRQAQRIGQERDVAQGERKRAESERERAEAVLEFMIGSFRRADPANARGKEVTAREILNSGATSITELRGQPALQATLLDTIGSVYLSLGEADDAQPLIEQGLSVRRALFGAENSDVAASLYSLNRVYEQKGQLQTAEKLAREALAMNQKLTGDTSLETAGSQCRLGVIEYRQGELAAAEGLFHACLETRIARLGNDNEQLTVPLDNLARIDQDRLDYVSAERLYRRTLEIDRRTHGEDHPQFIRHLQNLATMLNAKGDFAAAEPLFRQAVDLYRRILGPDHPETVDAISNMGRLFMDTGRLDEAQKAFETALEVDRRVRGADHSYVGYELANLGTLALERHHFPEAERRYQEAIEIYGKTLPPTHGFIAVALTMLGRCRVEAGRPLEAEPVLTQALDAWRKEHGEQSVEYALTNAWLGRARLMQRRWTEAEQALRDSYPILLNSPRRADRTASQLVRSWIEELYQSTGHPEAARKYLLQFKSPA